MHRNTQQQCIPPSIINNYLQPTDDAMLHWQELQITRSIADNTVNRVVESYTTLFDDAEDAPNTGLEESAILMAINEHGLQQPPQNNEATLRNHRDYLADRMTANFDFDQCFNDIDDDTESDDDDDVADDDSGSGFDDNENGGGDDSAQHVDFMEAAVAVAIRKKGLTTGAAPFTAIQMSSNR